MIVCGIDLSLAKTGLVVLEEGGRVLSASLIKSKPCGDLPIDETRRIKKIIEDVFEKIDSILPDTDPTLIAIEGLAFMAQGTSLTQLAAAHHLVRFLCDEFGWPFVVIFPTTLKKFASGSGKTEKDQLSMIAYRDYSFEGGENNIVDAFFLAATGLALLGSPIKKLGAPQQEVIKLLSKQL